VVSAFSSFSAVTQLQHPTYKKYPVPHICKGSLPAHMEEEDLGEVANQK